MVEGGGTVRKAKGFPDLADRVDLPRLWGRQGFWQIRLRWAVAPLMIAGILVGRAVGFEFRVAPILLIALASPLYNAVFALVLRRYRAQLQAEPGLDRLFMMVEVVVDYAAMFLLIYFTGGVSSPLIVFLIFHVIIAAIQFSPNTAYALAGVAAAGLWLVLAGQAGGWLPGHHISYRGVPVHFMEQPAYAAVVLLFFTLTLFITAAMVSRIMGRLRDRVGDLAAATSDLVKANNRLQSLYTMLSVIGAERRMEAVLPIVTAELAKVTGAPAVAVKLLSDDRTSLRYVAAYGLPDELIAKKTVYLAQSQINRRVIESEELVQVPTDQADALQLARELSDLGLRLAVLVPLKVEERVIGTLSFYSRTVDRFAEHDQEFLRLAAELVAIAIDNARAYEAIQRLIEERTQFTLEVAHNLRAPLSAGLSILDLVNDGYLGELNARQAEHLERLDGRLRALNQTIGDLLAIAQTRDRTRKIPDVQVQLGELAAHTDEVFREEAAGKGVEYVVEAEPDLPAICSGAGVLQRVMENLVSNAIKYTPCGGRVRVKFESGAPGEVIIKVHDNGIGIPATEQVKLFREFFRASNARQMTAEGTGLGLVLVRQAVERQGGHMSLESDEGEGTTVVVALPVEKPQPSSG